VATAFLAMGEAKFAALVAAQEIMEVSGDD
jgi:hypothetical protein